MWWLQALVACAALVASTADHPAGGGYGQPAPYGPPPAPSYHPPVYPPPLPPPVSYAAIPVYEEPDEGKKGGFGKFFKGIRDGLSVFGGGGKGGRGKGKVKVKPAPVVHVPQCQPVTQFVTEYITEAHPVPVVHTEIVENVVPTVVYQTKFEKQLETAFVTNVETERVTVTYTKSIVVPRLSYITQTETEVRTNNVFQSTTQVSFTPLLQTVAVTETATVTRVATVPDVRVTTVDRVRVLPPTAYLTVTEPQVVQSLVYQTETEHVTLKETEYVPQYITQYGQPEVLTTTLYSHITTSVYGPEPQVSQVTVTQQVREYVPTITTQNQYITTTFYRENYITNTQYHTEYVTKIQYVTQTEFNEQTQVVTDYVTVWPQCDGYNTNQAPLQLSPAFPAVLQQGGGSSDLLQPVIQQRGDIGITLQPVIQQGGGTSDPLPPVIQQGVGGVSQPAAQGYVSPAPQIFGSG